MQQVHAFQCTDPTAVICFDEENTRQLVTNINLLEDWIEQANALCGEKAK